MRRLGVIAVSLLGFLCAMPKPGWADQKSDDIQTLLRLTHRDLDEVTMRNAREASILMQRFEDRHPELTATQIKQMNAVTQDFSRRFVASIESETSSFYYEHLSDAHIRATIAFLQSPDGQAYMQATRDLRRALIDSLRQRMPDLLQGLIQQYANILKIHPGMPSLGAPQIKT